MKRIFALALLTSLACARVSAPETSPVEPACSRTRALELAGGAVQLVEQQGDKDGAFSFAVSMVVTLQAMGLITEQDVDGFRSLLSDALKEHRKRAGMTL